MKVSALLAATVLAACLALCGCASSTGSGQAAAMGGEYKRLIEQQKQRTAALAAPEEASKKQPEPDAEGYERLGDAYSRQGNVLMAVVEYRKALRLDARRAAVRCKVGRLLLRQGMTAEATREFEEALKDAPASGAAHFGLGLALLAGGRQDKAERSLHRAAELDPSLWQAHVCLGFIYDRRKLFSTAIAEYDKALAANPASAAVLNNRGVSCYLSGDCEQSARSFIAALRIDPANTRLYNNLGLAYACLGRFDDALEAFRKGGSAASAQNNMGFIYMAQGRYGEAARAFQEAMDASPTFYVKARENSDRLAAFAKSAGSQAQEWP